MATDLLAMVASRHARTISRTATRKPAMHAVKTASKMVARPPKRTFNPSVTLAGAAGAGAATAAASWITCEGTAGGRRGASGADTAFADTTTRARSSRGKRLRGKIESAALRDTTLAAALE